jgi:protein-S-isoprenylcysteine O-methyltransferase Ste14
MLVSAILNTSLFSNQIIRGIGLGLLYLGTVIFIIAMVTMRDSWRAGITHEDKTSMVTSGIYNYSRNPAFLGFDLTYLGACIDFGNIILMVIAVITIILMHLQILQEEKFLENTFQQGYIEYKRKVRRYL